MPESAMGLIRLFNLFFLVSMNILLAVSGALRAMRAVGGSESPLLVICLGDGISSFIEGDSRFFAARGAETSVH